MARWQIRGLTVLPMLALSAACTEPTGSEVGSAEGSEAASSGNYYEEARRRILDRHDLPRTEEQLGRSYTDLAPGHLGEDNAFNLPSKAADGDLMGFNPRTEWTGGGLRNRVRDDLFALLLEHR